MLAAPGRNVFSLLAPPPIASTHTNAILEITKRVPGITRTLLLYRFIQLAGLPLTALYFIARLVTQREYWSHFGERLGLLSRSFTRTKPGSIWLHAVSLGEIASALPLIEHLRRQHPLVPIYLSTATIAGRRAAERDLDALVNGLFYSPLDYVSCVRRVLRTIRPALLIVLETEIWPNLYVETTHTGARLAILNGRISDRAWPQYRRWRRLFAPILQLPDTISVQSGKDYDRYLQLGVPASKLRVEGNLKYDACAVRPPLSLEIFGAEQVWIAASTVGPNERGSLTRHAVDEDDILIRAFQALAVEFPHLLLILAPRQPARFPVVAQKLERSGLPFIRRTSRATSLQLPGVVLLDSVGELSRLYSYASVVFVGGSLAPRGGHNIIEPAAAGAPIVVGPNMQNFEAIMADFVQANAIAQIESDQELLPAVRRLLVNRDAARDLGRRARELTEQQRGISERLANSMYPLFSPATLARPHSFAGRMFLGALSFVWREAGIVKRRRAEKYADAQPPLDVPVISIGGITVGGSGKTPFTIYLARRLQERGFQPAILTRGYGRQSAAKSLVFVPGSKAPATMTGDEAQMLLKRGQAPIGIGGNRYETARVLLTHLPETDILLLDDGFQHARLKRDLDIVLIDGLDPFGEGEVFPLGRLREPLSALRRAAMFVVSRVSDDLRYQAICAELRRYNAHAPVFRTRLLARQWRDYRTGRVLPDPPAGRVAAFCGLGNPQSFWNTLESLGLEVVFRWAFDDHHAYKPYELQRIAHQAQAAGAEILVTTEKDRINCPSALERAIAPFDLAWLEIDFELDDEPAFFSQLNRILRTGAVV